MNIAIVIDVYDNLTNGTIMTAYRFVNELKSRGHNVRVIGIGAKGENDVNAEKRNIPIATWVAEMQNMGFAEPDEAMFRRAFKGMDIVHFYMPFKFERVGAKVAREMGIPTTAAFHVQPENITFNMGLRHDKVLPEILYTAFNDEFYKYFDHIHCPSRFIAEQLKAHGYSGKLHVISNGVNDKFVPLDTPKPLNKNAINICMIGRYANEKRQDVLINACALSKYHDKIHLTLAGKGPNEKKLRKLCDNKLDNKVRMGFYNESQLINMLHAQDLYVHAADIEIEAIGCIEAFATGLVPIIANSCRSATPQFALDERSLFEAGNPEQLAERIDYWIDHPEELKTQRQKYIENAKRYSLHNSILKAERMFDQAIKDYNVKRVINENENLENIVKRVVAKY